MAAPPIAERHFPWWHQLSPVKEPVRMASTGNLTLSGLQTIDGVVGVANDPVLVKDNSTGSQNGIWLMKSGAWERRYDLNSDDPGYGFEVGVIEGTVNAGTLWQNTNTSAPTIDTTALTFAAVSAGGGAVDYESVGHYELLMDGGSPPEPLEDGSGTDWLYVWVP